MEKRKLTKEDLDKVRNIEGFPIGKDEDIIALSDAPYYTACPNPFIKEFIEENGTPYDEETDDYQCEPFAADVSEGKTDPIYMAHTYHTKVPYKAIMKYILHYTSPGDIVLDGFCGTGMTGVACRMCNSADIKIKGSFSKDEQTNWGLRKAIISDLSPIATYIAHNYNTDINVGKFSQEFSDLITKCKKKFDYLYLTKHTDSSSTFGDGKGVINYVVWSDVFICPHCGKDFIFWDVAIENNAVKKELICPHCGAKLKKGKCERYQEVYYDYRLNKTVSCAKQVPVMINYTYEGKKFDKKPDFEDLALIEQAKKIAVNYDVPFDELPPGDNTEQPKNSHHFTNVHQFYYNRSAIIFSWVLEEANQYSYADAIKFVVTAILIKTGSKLHNIGFKNGRINLAGAMPNVLYVPSTVAERNIISLLLGKFNDVIKVYSNESKSDNAIIIQCCSATDMHINKNIIDYIFTDPPFGSNINYSELNFLWESWIKVKTNNKKEAIVNKTQGKSIVEYQDLMLKCFQQYYNALKPGRWMTVEFHNSLNAVWNAIQEAILRAGFIIADVRTLDKKQGTFKQMTTASAVKQDLVISAYKPREKFRKEFAKKAGTEETAWAFVRQHLSNLPVIVDANHNGKLDIIAERQAYLLFDRMVAYHIMNGIPVPIDAADFYKGLDERFLKRDGMYFLPDQVNEYDTARIKMDVEPIQFTMFVTNEKSAIAWLYQQLSVENGGPQTYAELQPKFMQEIKSVDRYENMPELSVMLEENFIQDEKGRWYIPDRTKEGDVAKLREKNLWKEFEGYMNSKGKLKLFRSEAIRAGFSRLWKEKNYQAIVDIAERLPEQTIQEDDKLLMYYDISLSRVQ